MKVAPHTEQLFAGGVVKFYSAHFGVWFYQKNFARELLAWQNLAETGLHPIARMERCPLA